MSSSEVPLKMKLSNNFQRFFFKVEIGEWSSRFPFVSMTHTRTHTSAVASEAHAHTQFSSNFSPFYHQFDIFILCSENKPTRALSLTAAFSSPVKRGKGSQESAYLKEHQSTRKMLFGQTVPHCVTILAGTYSFSELYTIKSNRITVQSRTVCLCYHYLSEIFSMHQISRQSLSDAKK